MRTRAKIKNMKPYPATNQSVGKFPAVIIWRLLFTLVPFGFKAHRLLVMFAPEGPFFKIPWGKQRLVLLSEWVRQPNSATTPLYCGPKYQNPEYFKILRPRLNGLTSGLIVDVGANIGAYTLNIRSHCSNPIIAFEPDPNTFGVLKLSLKESRVKDVTIENIACGSSKGTLAFLRGTNGSVLPYSAIGEHIDEEKLIKVPVVRIDDRLANEGRVSLMKVDCEGYEVEIIKGAIETLRNHRPLLFIEVHPRMLENFHSNPKEVCDLLEPIYELTFWTLRKSEEPKAQISRFLNRYRRGVKRLSSKREFLDLANRKNPPAQIFLLAKAKDRVV